MTKKKIAEISADLAELITEHCENSKTGEISLKVLAKLINDYLTKNLL